MLNWVDSPEGVLEICHLRVLPDRLIFKAISFSSSGQWTIEASAISDGKNSYLTDVLVADSFGTSSDGVQLVFDRVEISDDGTDGFLAGEWIERSGRSRFAGEIAIDSEPV